MDASPVYMTAIGSWWMVFADVYMTIWVATTYLICHRFGIRRSRTILSATMIAFSLIVFVFDVTRPTLGLVVSLLLMGIDFFTLGCSMILWGLSFASLEKHFAARNVIGAMISAVALTLIGLIVTMFIPSSWATEICTAAASLIMATEQIPLRNHQRPARPRPKKHVAYLLGQRLIYGFAYGFFPCLALSLASRSFDIVLFVYAMIIIAVIFVLIFKSPVMLPSYVIISCGILLIPFAKGGLTSMVFAMNAGIWLSWQALSSVQLSDLKEKLGVSELVISLFDKMAIAVAILIGSIVAHVLRDTLGNLLLGGVVESTLLMTFFALAIMTSFTIAGLVQARQEDDVQVQVEIKSNEREERQLDAIAQEFGLSAREREVIGMLAQGYTSAFIAEKLGVMTGTSKSHIAHIYQKLGVHHKDEMLELVDNYGKEQ
jgi:DNA-binding CsgD family transcriptional regulator